MEKYDFIKSTFNFSNAPIKRFVKIEKKEDLLKNVSSGLSAFLFSECSALVVSKYLPTYLVFFFLICRLRTPHQYW